jgi:hypothetical protein
MQGEMGMSESRPQSDADGLRKQIGERANALWESEGRPHGRDLDHSRADAEIIAARNTASAANPPTPASSTSRGKTDP